MYWRLRRLLDKIPWRKNAAAIRSLRSRVDTLEDALVDQRLVNLIRIRTYVKGQPLARENPRQPIAVQDLLERIEKLEERK